jgi:ribonuclease III family protein
MTMATKDYHPRILAFVGDAIFDVWVRTALLDKTQDLNTLHQASVACVRAEAQARVLRELVPQLSPELQDLARRSRNVISPPKGRKLDQQHYRDASALEAVIGYWALNTPETLEALQRQVLGLIQQLEIIPLDADKGCPETLQ